LQLGWHVPQLILLLVVLDVVLLLELVVKQLVLDP
jgi:hypothetical protein